MKKIIGFLIVSIILVLIALGSGAYNMAATEKHWAVTEKIIAWVRDNSIEARAKNQQVPALDDEQMRLMGAEHYDAMCTVCHLAPGMKPTELSLGLYPQAPKFFEREPSKNQNQTEKLERARAHFWVIKNGLKMTAMPAWGLSHDDNSIWAMVAFVLELGAMTPEQYQQIVQAAKTQSHDHDHQDNQGHEHQGHTHE